MKASLAAFFLTLLVSTGVWAAKGPEIDIVDNKFSVSAESVSLGRLLQLFDLATGMKSKVPPELANRNLSVRFSGLTLTDAVRKMFQGQTFDYVMVNGQGIIITAASQNLTGTESSAAPVYNPAPLVQPGDQPFVQDFNPMQQQPAVVQTPFGPIANPRAQQQQQPNAPLNVPGQQNSLFPQTQPYGQPQIQQQPPVQIVPGGQLGTPTPTPFGTPSSFGAPTINTPNQGLFGTPSVFPTPAQQR